MGTFASSDWTRCWMCQVPTDHEAHSQDAAGTAAGTIVSVLRLTT